ncbi:T9SS type A sorting domain-containing protein [Kordia jejudonensis]|uniref:T9SS type A sorting domain-containing protein n=1 Tax=Kordia jejudonensis TaxID=1348245 RepID=UPI000A6C7F0F|nr:T9SS type A sorting domain-containing protein [Kordia jejudonensis]
MKKILLTILLCTAFQIHAQYTFDQIDIWAGSNGSAPKYLTELNGQLYFQASEITPSFKKLYKSDGTAAGTQIVATNLNSGAGYSPESFYVMNGELYFSAFVSGIGQELYKTDGTDAGTVLLKDIRTGSSSGLDFNSNDDNQLFVEYNGELYFRGSTNSSIELWKTDGTEVGTVSVKNFEAATNGAPTFMTKPGKNILGVVYNGLLYFYVNRGGNGELWKTDGTTANTVLVRSNLNLISEMIVFNNELLFVAEDNTSPEGRELWKTDGTFAGTTIKHDIFPNNLNPAFGLGSNPSYLTIFNNELYFKARSYNGTSGQIIGSELWKTDGTTASLVKDIDTDNLASGLGIPNFTIYNNELYFAASDNSTSDFELWKTDGTESGTVKVISATDTGESIEFLKAVVYANKLFYFDSQQLWVTNGTPAGTEVLTGNSEEILLISSFSLLEYQNKLWFAGTKSGNGNELTSLTDASVLSTTNFETTAIQMYPNPTSNRIRFSGMQESFRYEIYDVLGNLITKGNLKNSQSLIDVSTMNTGMYVVNIASKTHTKTFKLLKN